MANRTERTESYRDPCPKCGDRLLGFTKTDYITHLRENGESLAARIEEKLVVEESSDSDGIPRGSVEDEVHLRE
jgi:hypothetical protein